MLIAAGIGDEARFRAVWDVDRASTCSGRITCWRGAGPTAPSSMRRPAADADLVAAGALALAGQRFGDRQLVAAARRDRRAPCSPSETVAVGSWQVLLAGPWAADERVVNPSYFAVGMMSQLYDVTGEPALAAGGGDGPPAARRADRDGPVARARLGGGRRRRRRRDGPAGAVAAATCSRGSRPGGRTCSWPSTATVVARPSRHGRGRSCAPRPTARSTPPTASTAHPRRPRPTRSPWSPRRLRPTPPATTRRGRRAARSGVRARPPDTDLLRRGVGGDRPAVARHRRPRRLPQLGVVGRGDAPADC